MYDSSAGMPRSRATVGPAEAGSAMPKDVTQPKKTSKLLVGCGIGCGLLILGVVALGVGGAILGHNVASGFNEAVTAATLLDEQFATVDAYVPPAEGLTEEQLERFLRVRDDSSGARIKIENAFGALPMSEARRDELDAQKGTRKLRSVFGIVRAAFGLGARMGEFFEARNQALLDQGMGMGEYVWVYTVAYYAGLGHELEDGPGEEGELSTSPTRLRRELRGMLERQLQALPADADPGWRDTLVREVEQVRDAGRVPWQDGLPEQMTAVLAPFRDRLEAAYSPATNPFELTRPKKQGSFAFTVD